MSDEGNFAVRFHALSSGQVTLKLTVKGRHSKMSPMTDSITIQVILFLSHHMPYQSSIIAFEVVWQ